MLGAGVLTFASSARIVVVHALPRGVTNKFVLDQRPSEQGESGKGYAAVPPHAYLHPLWAFGRPSQTFNLEAPARPARLFRGGLVLHELCAQRVP